MSYRHIRKRFADFLADARGSIAILGAAFTLCALGALAIGIDVSSVLLDRRRLQGSADLAAIAAAADLSNATKAARATLAANGLATPREITVTLGNYVADPNTAVAGRFRPNVTPYNAAQVRVGTDSSLYFGRKLVSADSLVIRATALAVNTQLASFSVGSRLASLNGGIANALLSSLLGGSITLGVMDYNALASAKVDILPFVSALATRVNLTAGTYDQALAANAKVGDVVSAIADTAQNTISVTALKQIALAAKPSQIVDLTKILSLGPYGKLKVGDPGAGLTTQVSALDLLNAVAQVSNGTNQVSLNLGAQVPGLLGLTATLNIGERPQNSPWLAIGGPDVIVRTAQTRLRLVAQVGGTGSLLGKLINLPIAIDLAAAQARLSSLSCGKNPSVDAAVGVAARPSVAELWVGEPTNPTAWANGTAAPQVGSTALVNLLTLVKITVYSHVAATNVSEQTLNFSAADIASATVKTVKTTNVLQTTLSSLTKNLDIQATLIGLNIPDLGTGALLSAILTPVGALLDPVVNSLLDVLGVSIGEADVTVRGIRCDGAALVG